MKAATLELLICPNCHSRLTFEGPNVGNIERGTLCCAGCGRDYPLVDGIPQFVRQRDLTGLNRRFSVLYDWFSWVYRAFSWAAFMAIGTPEEKARREALDRLEPRGGRVLEVSIGPGVNLPYLMDRKDVGEVAGLDISPGQLRRCQSYLKRQRWAVDLFLGSAEQLPFADHSFESVFHIGGINFFNDKGAAINEMIRVAKPGARILIADENEKGARAYERILPGFKNSFKGKREAITAPTELVPPAVQEMRVFDIWNGWLYCIEFRAPR